MLSREDDLHRLAEIERAAYGDKLSGFSSLNGLRGLREESDRKNAVIWMLFVNKAGVAEIEAPFGCLPHETGDLEGFAIVWNVVDECHIQNLAISPKKQGQGLGTLLLQTVMKRSSEQGFQHFFLEVRAGNSKALCLYKKSGFKVLYERKRYYADGENALVCFFSFDPNRQAFV